MITLCESDAEWTVEGRRLLSRETPTFSYIVIVLMVQQDRGRRGAMQLPARLPTFPTLREAATALPDSPPVVDVLK